MPEQELLEKIEAQEKKLDAIYASVEKLRKYFLWTLIITGVTVVVPLIILLVAIPFIMNTFSSIYGGLL